MGICEAFIFFYEKIRFINYFNNELITNYFFKYFLYQQVTSDKTDTSKAKLITYINTTLHIFFHHPTLTSGDTLKVKCCRSTSFFSQKQPLKGVPSKRGSENVQQIYRRTPMAKCDFNKVAKQLY